MTSEQVDQVADHDPSETPEKTDFMPLYNEPEFIGATDDKKELTDDGWEIF